MGVKVILVGTHPTSLPLETFKISDQIDFIALREYDETIVELANNLENKTSLDNIKGIFDQLRVIVYVSGMNAPQYSHLHYIVFV